MSILSGLKAASANVEKETNQIMSGGVPATGAYPVTIEMAFIDYSKGGAMALNIHTTGAMTQKLKLWITSGDAKGNLPYYIDRNGKQKFLPGYSVANDICMMTTGEEIGDLDTEEKQVNIYSFDEGKDVVTPVQALTDVIGGVVTLGVIKQIVVKNTKQDDGSYAPSGETREELEVAIVFQAETNMTKLEVLAEEEEASFYTAWTDKFTPDYVRNKAKGASGASPAKAGAPAAQKKSGGFKFKK